MGGTAYQIWGELDESRLQPQIVQSNFLDKVLGRKKVQKVKVAEWGGRKNYEVPIGSLKILSKDFLNYLDKIIPEPWPATRYVSDFFQEVIKIYVRGEQTEGDPSPKWYIQLSFSGCAGMAEASAELGSHWVDIWYQCNKNRLVQEILLPYGFTPDQQQPSNFTEKVLFFPLSQAGYALYNVDRADCDDDEEVEGSKLFELDEGFLEYMDDVGCLSELDDLFGPKMADGKCHCQLCDPQFDLSVLKGLSFGN